MPTACSRSAHACRTSPPVRTPVHAGRRDRHQCESIRRPQASRAGASKPMRVLRWMRSPNPCKAGTRTAHGPRARTNSPTSWRDTVGTLTHAPQRDTVLPYEGDVIGAVQRSSARSAMDDIVVCAAGTLPAELHKLWRAGKPGGVSRRIRLLVHGLRDRRRPRREARAARARSDRDASATAAI